MLLKTALNETHKKLNARMVDFGGWDMPVIYTNQIDEHHAVRQKAGLFDVSHMGEIIITGPQAFELVQKLVSKDISKMENGRVSLGVMCDYNGGIIDDLTVYKFNDQTYMLVVNAGTLPDDYDWISEQAKEFNVKIDNVSDNIVKLDLQGPAAQTILQKLTDTDLALIKRYWFKNIYVDGIEMTVSRSGYTGEDGFELYMPSEYGERLWNKLLDMGAHYGLIPCGLGCRDTLRTEAGMMLYGHDIDRNHTPLECVYGWAVSFEKEFIGKVALARQNEEGLTRKLIGFEMMDRGIARQHYPIYVNGEEVGEVTSGTPSPTLNKNIGMGYIKFGLHEIGGIIQIKIRDNFTPAKIVPLPFYKR